jgi:apolipoprotein N-acyltransferase
MRATANSKKNGHKDRILLLAAVLFGLVSTSFAPLEFVGLWALFPLLWLEAESRRSASLTVFAFYLSISRGILPGACVFFRDGSFIRAFVLWIFSAAALTAPWGFLWLPQDSRFLKRTWRPIAAILASVPPPLGLIGWGNPLTAAGLFFPGWGCLGLVFMLSFYIGAVLNRKLRRSLVVVILVGVSFLKLPASSDITMLGDIKILGIDTSFGRMASGSGDFDAQYERELKVFQSIRDLERNGVLDGVDVAILPETIIGRMNPSVRRRWEQFLDPFAEKGTVFAAGAEIPTNKGMSYDNVMVTFEGEKKHQMAKQRFPVPFSMYRPFSDTGANGYLSSSSHISTITLKGGKFGFIVCYEQFLIWPFLSLLSRSPDVIVAPSNLWWCKDTSLPGIQAATVRLWAASFGVPVIVSVNQ